MDFYLIGIICFGLGLVAAEVVLPGGISMALGLSLLVLAAARHWQWVESWAHLGIMWLIIAPVFVACGMFAAQKLFGGGGDKIPYDEEAAAKGQEVEVLSDISPDNDSGRVKWQGTTWNARSTSGLIYASEKAVIVRRENIVLIIGKKTEE